MLWIDIDNSPHVNIFRPIINYFEKNNIDYLVTARDYAQTLDLLRLYNINFLEIGSYGGKKKLSKIFNLFHRSKLLTQKLNRYDISLALSHGSRTQLLATKLLGIKSVLMFDYEYTEHIIFNTLSSYLLCPKYIPDSRLKEVGYNLKKIIKYDGFKEELYLSVFEPDPNFRKNIGVDESSILIIIRPPSMTSNYHNEKSEKILKRLIKLIKSSNENLFTIIVPRTKYDQDLVKKLILGGEDKFRILQKAVDGLQLLYSADYVFSGGGTMNRESALLGTKTYSFFTGKRPYLDEYLSEMNRLNFINDVLDIDKITFEKYNKLPLNINKSLTEEIASIILDINKRK